jgi:hypothetical protein
VKNATKPSQRRLAYHNMKDSGILTLETQKRIAEKENDIERKRLAIEN